MARDSGQRMIRELLDDPIEFNKRGRAYQLLQQYFDGFPSETLRPLLRSHDAMVQRAAVFVVSELGADACHLANDVVPLTASTDRYLKYLALEVVAVCSQGEATNTFAHVVQSLRSDDDVVRGLAMRLVANANAQQLRAALGFFQTPASSDRLDEHGLSVLLEGESVQPGEIRRMLDHSEPLLRKYGAMAAKRLMKAFPELLVTATSIEDQDVRQFCERTERQTRR